METWTKPRFEPMQKSLIGGHIQTPLGQMLAILDPAGALVRLDFVDDERAADCWEWTQSLRMDPHAVAPIAAQLEDYFCGVQHVFTLPLAPRGSEFLMRAWQYLAKIPFGATTTYGALARQLQPASSARAIGRANALNAISIIIPCHRIIAADGSLSGYSAGLERKAALLAHEGSLRQARLFVAACR